MISEWDTFYGRALPLSFAISLLADRKKCNAETDEQAQKNCMATEAKKVLKDFKEWPKEWGELPNIKHLSYLRGLDGKVVEDEERKTEDRGLPPPSPDVEKHPEDASGPAQLDYIRRLALEYKRNSADFRAIGILGSDVYDKLLLVRALRDVFPDAIFFTTDLDARLWNHSEIRWTRNMVIASSLGLRLVEDRDEAQPASGDEKFAEVLDEVKKRQRQLSPFRDNYQTSVYYATLFGPRTSGDSRPKGPADRTPSII